MTLNFTAKVVHFDDEIFEIEKIQKILSKGNIGFNYKLHSLQEPDQFESEIGKLNQVHCFLLDIYHKEKGKIGVEIAKIARRKFPSAVIIMRSSLDDAKNIQDCLEAGADDFISKEASDSEFTLRVSHAISMRFGEIKLDKASAGKVDFIVGSTMEGVNKRIPRILNSAISSVFIGGESGCGKEVVADLFGAHLGKTVPLVRVNCGAIAPTLLESELFGHVKGAFTGASADKRGLMEAANGGWIFLDEVATLSKSAQVALLRVLETGDITRVGDHKARKIRVKVLSATNEDIPKMVEKGEFRGDLWQRLIEARIDLPPLRNRRQEIPPLIDYFCKSMSGGPYKIAQTAVKVLVSCNWQGGNVRELRNCLRAMTEFHVGGLLTPLGIPGHILSSLTDEEKADADAILAQHKSNQPAAAPEPKSSNAVSDGTQAVPQPSSSTGPVSGALVVPCELENGVSFEELTNLMLIELCKATFQHHGKLSMRKFSKTIGVSRSAITARLKGIVQKGLVELEVLNQYISLGDQVDS